MCSAWRKENPVEGDFDQPATATATSRRKRNQKRARSDADGTISSDDEGDFNSAAGSDLIGRKFQLAKAFEEHVEGMCAATELGSHTTEDGEEVDVLWYQYDDPDTGDVCDEFSDIEEVRAWVQEHEES